MSQGTMNPLPGDQPARGKGGMSTLVIVLLVLLVLGLVCCGGCVGCMYLGYQTVSGYTDSAMAKIRTNEQVVEQLGTDLTSGIPQVNIVNNTATATFPVTGSKGTGTVHAQYEHGPNGWEPTSIRVTTADGREIIVPTADDPTNLEFDTGDDSGIEMEEASTVPANGDPAESTDM
jgi:hypothetical protein